MGQGAQMRGYGDGFEVPLMVLSRIGRMGVVPENVVGSMETCFVKWLMWWCRLGN